MNELNKTPRFTKTLFGETVPLEQAKLQERFFLPPFSILDTRRGEWLQRKRAWLELGIHGELGRGDNLLRMSESAKIHRRDYSKRKQYARAFTTDLMGGEDPKYRKPPKGLLLQSNSVRDPQYYYIKKKVEKKLGREITTREFEKEHYPYYMKTQFRSGLSSSGTSVFDPVLCEIIYRWFCPKNGLILDPFAGGSVRGIVAHYLDYRYIGIDLLQPQIDANRQQAEDILKDKPHPTWIVGNALNIDKLCPEKEVDLIFSCPPYFNLEVYSDLPEDLSNLTWEEFKRQYKIIIKKCYDLLLPNRFACFVVSEIRDRETGFYRNFVGYTIESFLEAGFHLYNEIILINIAGSLPIRVGIQFGQYRKVGRTHQNVLVFYKGDVRQIPLYFEDMKIQTEGALREFTSWEEIDWGKDENKEQKILF